MNLRLADYCGQILAGLADQDPRIWVLDGDLADSDGAIHFGERHRDRFLMAGIAEQNMVSMAAGMAEEGFRPFVFSFAAFLCFRAYDQIRVCVTQCHQPVTLIGSHGGGLGGRNGRTHIALNDLALMLTLPEMNVWCPADVPDVEYALRRVLSEAAPAYIRLPRRVINRGDDLAGLPSSCRWITSPSSVAFVSTGLATHWALEARKRLAERLPDLGVLHVLNLNDEKALSEALGPVRHAIVIEDHHPLGGLASLVQRSLPGLRVTGLAWPFNWCGRSGSDEALLSAGGLSGDQLVSALNAGV